MLTDKQKRQLKYLDQKSHRPGYIYDLDCRDCNQQAYLSDDARKAVRQFMNDHAGHFVSLTAIAAGKALPRKTDPVPRTETLHHWATDDAFRRLLNLGQELAKLSRRDKTYQPLLAQARHAWSCIKTDDSGKSVPMIMSNLETVLNTKGMSLYGQ